MIGVLTPSFVHPDDVEPVTELLRAQLEGLPARSPLYADLFAEHGISAAALSGLADLRAFPFTTKQMLRDSQQAAPPLGRHAGVAMSEVVRVHASTGTTGRPSWVGVTRRDAAAWTDMVARAFTTMGTRREDVVLHGAGLTLFVGGLPIRDALERIGATVVPIGTGGAATRVSSGSRRSSSAANRAAGNRRSARMSSRSGVRRSPKASATRTWRRCCSARHPAARACGSPAAGT